MTDPLRGRMGLLTVREAAELLRVSTRTIQRRIRSGQLRAVYPLGVGPRIPAEEIQRVLGTRPPKRDPEVEREVGSFLV